MRIDYLITPKLIEEAEKLGAYGPALACWFKEEPRQAREVVGRYFGVLLAHGSYLLTDAQFDVCVKGRPDTALQYTLDRLTDEQLDWCVKRAPWEALEYALDRLTDEQFDVCVKREPRAALTCAFDRLTPEQIAWCRGNK